MTTWHSKPNRSGRLSERLAFGLGPGSRGEGLDHGDFGRRQAREQILQIVKWIDPVAATTPQQRVDDRTTFPSLGVPNEQPVLFVMESFS